MNTQTSYLQQTQSQHDSFVEFGHRLLQNFTVKRMFEEHSFLCPDFPSQHTSPMYIPQHQGNDSNIKNSPEHVQRAKQVHEESKSYLFERKVQEELKLGNFDSRPLSREALFVECICMIRSDVDVRLINLAHRCILHIFGSAVADDDNAFLNVAMHLLYDMQILEMTNFSSMSAMESDNFRGDSYHQSWNAERHFETMKHKLHTRAHPSRFDFTNADKLGNNCRSLLTDLVFHVRFMALSKMHSRHQRSFRVKSASATLPKFTNHVNSFQDASLICAPKTFFNPPVPPQRRPRGGLWIDLSKFDH